MCRLPRTVLDGSIPPHGNSRYFDVAREFSRLIAAEGGVSEATVRREIGQIDYHLAA